MDDIFSIYSLKIIMQGKIGRFTEGFIEKWTQNILKKCQLFRTDLQYMGNTIFIKDKRVCVRPLRSRLETVKNLNPPLQ